MKLLITMWHSAKTAHEGKIWFSSYGQKMVSTNQIPIFFNCQYLVNGLTSDSDFLHVDRHECMQQGLLMSFLKKIVFHGTQVILGLKMAHPRNFGSAVRVFFEILNYERGQRVHENYINGFPEKNSRLEQWAILGIKCSVLITLDWL